MRKKNGVNEDDGKRVEGCGRSINIGGARREEVGGSSVGVSQTRRESHMMFDIWLE